MKEISQTPTIKGEKGGRAEVSPNVRSSAKFKQCVSFEVSLGVIRVNGNPVGFLSKADLGSLRVSEHGSGIAYHRPSQESHPLSPLHDPLHWRAKSDPKANMLSLQSFLRKGVSLAYVGSI